MNPADYEKIDEYDDIRISNIREDIGKGEFILEDLTKGINIKVKADLSEREKEILLEGGYLNYAKGLELD